MAKIKWALGLKNWTSISGQRHVYHVEYRSLKSLHGTDITFRKRVQTLAEHVDAGGALDMIEISPSGLILDGHHRYKVALKTYGSTERIPVQVHTVKDA